MADAPIMSGANAAVAATAPETEQVAQTPAAAVEEQTETQSSSLPAAAAPATETLAEKTTETEKTTAAEGAAAAASSSTEPAAAAAGGVLDTPQPPQPAVIRDRSDSLAINSADNEIAPVTSATADSGLVCNITLLLPNGNRHPFRIDERYLSKRGVEVPDVTDRKSVV